MNAVVSRRCLTRVMTDDDRGVEVAQLQSVMHRIQSSLRDVPMAQREYIANALLNLAVSRMLKEEGSPRAFCCGSAMSSPTAMRRRLPKEPST